VLSWISSSRRLLRGSRRRLHITDRQFGAFVARDYPRVVAGVTGIPPLLAFVTPVAAQLEALHPQFAAVDSLPFLGLPLTSVPSILLAMGAALVALGIVVLTTRGRGPLVVAAGLGLALVVIPLALSYPSKASDATKVAAVGRVALSPKAAAGAQKANQLIDGMVTQVNTEMLPGLATRLHVSQTALEASIARDYPAVAKGLLAWSTIKPGAVELVRRQVASVRDAETLNGLDFTPLPWYVMSPGIALLIAGLAALLTGPEPRARAAHDERAAEAESLAALAEPAA